MAEQRTTSASGAPVAGDELSRTVGPNGPTALQDTYVVQQMQHFNRERVHERVVHAKGSAAHGFLEVTITACEAPGPRRLGPIDPRLAPGADRVLPVEVERVRHFLPKSIVDRREWHDGSFCISRLGHRVARPRRWRR